VGNIAYFIIFFKFLVEIENMDGNEQGRREGKEKKRKEKKRNFFMEVENFNKKE